MFNGAQPVPVSRQYQGIAEYDRACLCVLRRGYDSIWASSSRPPSVLLGASGMDRFRITGSLGATSHLPGVGKIRLAAEGRFSTVRNWAIDFVAEGQTIWNNSNNVKMFHFGSCCYLIVSYVLKCYVSNDLWRFNSCNSIAFVPLWNVSGKMF